MDLPGYLSPCTITGDSLRPDMLLSTANKLYIIELTAGFETNQTNNARRKELKYRSLVSDISNDYHSTEFINLSISCFGIFGQSSESFLKICIELGFGNRSLQIHYFQAIYYCYSHDLQHILYEGQSMVQLRVS